MKKRYFLLFFIIFVAYFSLDLLNIWLNNNTIYLSEFVSNKVGQNINFKNIKVSFFSIKIEKINVLNKNIESEFSDVEVLLDSPIQFIATNNLISEINIDKITVIDKNQTLKNNINYKETIVNNKKLFEYFNLVNHVYIHNIYYKNENNQFEFNDFDTSNDTFYLKAKTTINLFNGKNFIEGKLNLNELFKKNITQGEINIYANNVDLKKISEKQLNSFKIQGEANIEQNIKFDNIGLNIEGISNFKNIKLLIHNKNYELEKVKIKNKFSNGQLLIESKETLKLNKQTIKDLNITMDFDLNTLFLNNFSLKSDKVNLNSSFLYKKEKNQTNIDIVTKIHYINLKFLSDLNILDSQHSEYYNKVKLNNSVLNTKISINGESIYLKKYTIETEFSYTKNNEIFTGKAYLEDKLIKIEKLFWNNNKINGNIFLNLENKKIIADLGLNLNNNLIEKIQKEYALPFLMTINTNNIYVNLKLTKQNEVVNYSGEILFNKNDLILKYNNHLFNIKELNGNLSFSTYNIEGFSLASTIIEKDGQILTDNRIIGKNNKNKLEIDFSSNFLKTVLVFDKNTDNLFINIPYFEYDKNKLTYDINTSLKTQNEEINLKLPKQINIIINKLKINHKDIKPL